VAQAADEEVSQRNLTDSPRDAVMEEVAEDKPSIPEESKVLDENPVEATNEAAVEEKAKEE